MLLAALQLCIIKYLLTFSEASIKWSFLPAPVSAAHKAPQCGQSRWVQLGWHNAVFHPASPLPGSIYGAEGVAVVFVRGRLNNCSDTPVHLDNDLFVNFTEYTSRQVFACAIPENTFAKPCDCLFNAQACFIFCLIRSYRLTKWQSDRSRLDRLGCWFPPLWWLRGYFY